jgi:hypothetical protein
MSRPASLKSLALLLLVALLPLGFTECSEGNYGTPFFYFREPLPDLLSHTGDHEFELKLPSSFDSGSLMIALTDEAGVTIPVDIDSIESGGDFEQGVARGAFETPLVGSYHLTAEVEVKIFFFFRISLKAGDVLQAVELADADECEILNQAECLLPYPSSRFLVEADTPTGHRIELPQIGLPEVNGPTPIPASMLSSLDGFSPTVQPLMHFPGGVDLAASGVSHLRSLSNSGPPYVDIRTHDDSSLDSSHPTVLLDWETGERLLHWIELDARADGNPDRQMLIMRPGQSLTPGRRYLVAVRNLVHPDGSPVEAEPTFAAIRDGKPTDIGAVTDRRVSLRPVFKKLHRAGINLHELILAFDFTVQSEHALTHQMLTMRDRGLEWLDEQIALGNKTFGVRTVEDFPNCQASGSAHRRIVTGRFQSPLFLDAPPVNSGVQFMNVDENDTPVQNGIMSAPYTVSIPCMLDDESHVLLLGHGIFGRGEGLVRGIPEGYHGALSDMPGAPQWNYISGATDWFGFSEPDFLWVGARIVGFGNSQLHNFEAFPDRHKQGQTNTLVLSRMMKLGVFNQDPAFQIEGEGIFPADGREQYYYGISMGGVQGLFHSAISQDIESFAVDVPSINFSMLLQRSTQFSVFDALLSGLGLTDPMAALIGIELLHEIWVSAEPAGYATHITRDPLPNTPAKKMLFTSAWLDHQVPNQGSHISARTLGLDMLHGSAQQGLVGIDDAAMGEALESAYVVYDTGVHDIFDPAHEPFIPPLANLVTRDDKCDPHGARPQIPAGILQLVTFLRPGGMVENFCEGICDADSPFEIGGGNATPCDPLN